MASDMLIS